MSAHKYVSSSTWLFLVRERKLRLLGTEQIDLYQMHGFDPATPVEQILRALDDLVRQGLVRAIGVILGLSRPEQLDANLAALDLTLSARDLATLDEASRMPAGYPGWMLGDASAARLALLTTGQLPEQH